MKLLKSHRSITKNGKFGKGSGKRREEECLREFDGGGSGDDGVTEEFGNEREQAILLREFAVTKRS